MNWHRKFGRVRRDYSRKSFSNPLFQRRLPPSVWRSRLKTLATLILVFGGIAYALYSGRFAATKIEIRGNEQIAAWEIRDAVTEALKGRRLLLVPRNNVLLLSEDELIAALNERFVFETVAVERTPPRSLVVTVKERVSTILMQMPDGRQAMLGLDGTVTRQYAPEEAIDLFLQAGPLKATETARKPKYFVLFNDKDEKLDLREAAARPSAVAAAIELPKLIGDAFGAAAAVRLHVDGKASSTVRVVTGEGWSIYLDTDQPLRDQIENAALIIKTKVGADRPRLDYVDVRYGEKVFFKLR